MVIPLKTEHHWTLALSRQEVLHTSNNTLNTFLFTFEDATGISSVQGDGTIDSSVDMIRARRRYARHCLEFRDEMGFLKAGDTVESVIQHLGRQHWEVIR